MLSGDKNLRAAVLVACLVSALVLACGTRDSSGAATDPTNTVTSVPTPTVSTDATSVPNPTSAVPLVPYTPTPIPEVEPIDPAVLEIIGAGKRKEFPQELMDGSPELPVEEVIRLWTEYTENTYTVESAGYILYNCQGGMQGAASVVAAPVNERLAANIEIIGPTKFPAQPWNHATRIVIDGLLYGRIVGKLQPPQADGRMAPNNDATSGAPSQADIYEKNDCPDYGGRDLEPTPMPPLPVSEPGDVRSIPDDLLSGSKSAEVWTEFLAGSHIAPIGVTQIGKIEAENDNPVLAGYMLKRHHLNGTYDLLLCGDGRYHWMGTAPVNVNDFAKPGWRNGQDGDWEVRSGNDGVNLQLLPDDPRPILKGAEFPLAVSGGEFHSTVVKHDRAPIDLVFEVREASGCE